RITGDAVALAKTILAHNEAYRGEKMRAAGEFDQLVRQATGVAKAPYVAEFVRLLLESGQQVLLFGWHREVYSIWREKLADYNPVMYTGTESPKEKQAAKDAFVAGDSRLMLISLRAGAGIDGLQHACSTVVFGELDWSPGVHEQCIGRIHRDGQREPVQAFFLISNEGSDPIVSDVLGVKLEQIEGVRNPGEHLVERRDLGENQLRQLAQRFLADHGVKVP
ncbi:C-terminal helicase domain-containing protein, partial [Pseudomonas aeruginosa]